jgi:hypothetical protein
MSAEPAARETLFARLLCDVMIPAEFSAAIRAQGYDVAEARTFPVDIQQEDSAILQTAAQQQRVVITCNYSDPQSNFCRLHEAWHAQGKQHAGIILIAQYQLSSRLGRWDVRDRLLTFLNHHTAEELSDHLWWLPQA